MKIFFPDFLKNMDSDPWTNGKTLGDKPVGLHPAMLFAVISIFFLGCSTAALKGKNEEDNSSRVKDSKYNFSLIQYISVLDFVDYKDEVNSGKFVAEAFMKKLIKKDYSVIDSSQIKTIMEAKSIRKPDADNLTIDTDIFAKLRDVVKIDVLFTGTVTDYTLTLPDKDALPVKKKGNKDGSEALASVGINVRVIDIKTGKVVWMDSTTAIADNMDDAVNDAVDQILSVFLNDLF